MTPRKAARFSDFVQFANWETLDRGPRRSTPIDFSVRGFTNGVFSLIRFFQDICIWKVGVRPTLPSNRLRMTRSGSFHIQIQDFTKCQPMSVKSVTPSTCKISPTLHHTCTHMLGTHASFPAISTLRWSVFGETLERGLRRYEGLTMDFFL